MSWLNFNESLNSIKGQLSSFASGVLADEIVEETESNGAPTKSKSEDLGERRKTHNAELQAVPQALHPENGNTWSWEPPDGPPSCDSLVSDLRKKIEALESEKKELIVSLEQLDVDCQQTTDKLVTLKDNLQTSHNELRADFEKLQREYGEVLKENMDKSKEIERLRAADLEEPEVERKETKLVQKYEELKSIYENNKRFSEEERAKNEEQRGLLKQLKEENATLRVKLEGRENLELEDKTEKLQKANYELVGELQDLKRENEELKSAKENFQMLQREDEKLKIITENLRSNIEELKNEKEVFRIERDKLKNEDLEELKSENKKLTQANEDLKIEFERSQSANEELKKRLTMNDNGGCKEKLNSELEELQNRNEALQKKLEELNRNNEKLKEEHEHMRSFAEKLENDLRAHKEVSRRLQNQNDETQNLLAKEKEALHEKYLGIITENMKKYIDSSTESNVPSFHPDEPQILEFAGKVETLLKLLLDFKCKTEALEKDLCGVTQEKNKVAAEKNFEIEKLLKNSEILSQEVISKTQAIKDYEDECGELMKNNDLLISELQNYKNSSGLQTISESNEDNLLLLETQLENANKKIQDMELIISDLENSKQEANLETQTELEYIKKQLNLTGQELNHSKEEHQDLILRHKQLEDEKRSLKAIVDKIKLEYENTEYKYTEANVAMETLKEENEECKNKALDMENSQKKLEAVNFNLGGKIELLQNVVDELKQKLDAEMENTAQKELHIRNLVERLQNSKMCETGLKLQVDTIYKELQTVAEAKQALEVKYNQSQADLEQVKFKEIQAKEEDQNGCEEPQENESVAAENHELKQNLAQVFQQNADLHQKIAFLEANLTEVTTSRNELVPLITAKHQENVQYHGEIQRLNHFLAAETEKAHSLEMQLHKLKTEPEPKRQDDEIEKLTDQNKFLREKCEVLAQNLLQEQSNVQKALSGSDKEQGLSKELERLRAHLVEIEDVYTQELLQAEHKNKEMRAKVNEIERREKDSSSIYTSVSIRANQQVETLQAQLQLVTNQRDELRVKVSDLEDAHNKQVAALTNLQLVLEQFQKERDKDVHQETERVRRQVTVERQIQQELRGEIAGLRLQLDESKQGLQAASRLTDQLEKCKQQIVSYKDEVTKLQDQVKTREAKYKELSTQTDSKVDKTLIKNLIIGYITSHSNDQNQILKIIATVLDFNQPESDKVHLNKPQHDGGWLGSILHPQSQDMSRQSLSEAFVRFLENESKPKVLPNLLITNQAKTAEGSSSATPRQSPSPRVLSEVVLPTFVDFGKSRNSSSILKDVLKDNS